MCFIVLYRAINMLCFAAHTHPAPSLRCSPLSQLYTACEQRNAVAVKAMCDGKLRLIDWQNPNSGHDHQVWCVRALVVCVV